MENNINKIFDSYQQMWTCTPFEETSMHVSSVICFETQFSLFTVHTLPMCFESVCCGDLASPVCVFVIFYSQHRLLLLRFGLSFISLRALPHNL